MARLSSEEAVKKVVDCFDSARRDCHDAFADKVARGYRAYRGVLERQSDAAQWTSKLHPAYAFQIIETTVANMLDDRTVFSCNPRPLIDDIERIQEYISGAEAIDLLMRYELDQDRFVEKQRPIALQAAIARISPVKIYWDYREAPRRRLVNVDQPIFHPEMPGVQIGSVPTLQESSDTVIVRDGPTIEPIDVLDFFWPESARDVQSAPWIIHRVWLDFDELKELEAQGIYQNVDELKQSRDMSGEEDVQHRYDDIFQRMSKKGLIEVLEYWSRDGQVISVGNRKVLLRNTDNPFWHGLKPFVVASFKPEAFQIGGISDIEIVQDLQEALWSTMNQRMDNLALINNAIVLLRNTAQDEDYVFAPGEFWYVEDPTEAQLWTPNPLPAEISLGAEAQLKGDMQNITGGMPFVAGVDSQTLDQKTATGVSIVTSLAQKHMSARRQQLTWAYERAGEQAISLLQQFVREDRIVPKIGADGAQNFMAVSPLQLQGRYVCSVEAVAESFMTQEKRAEAMSLMQLALQAAPFLQATGSPANIKAFMEDLLKAFDKRDLDRYFSQMPQVPMMGAGAGSLPGLAPSPAPGGMNDGTTAPSAADATSPSNQLSLSGQRHLQRAGAMRGGGTNV